MLEAPESEGNMSWATEGTGSGCPRCQALSILLGPSDITDGYAAPANHLWGKANNQVSDSSFRLGLVSSGHI